MQFIKKSQVMARQARFKSRFPGNAAFFCNASFVSSEQDKLADVHLSVTPTYFAIFPSNLSQTTHYPLKCLLAYCKPKVFMNQAGLLSHAIVTSISDQGQCVMSDIHTTDSQLYSETS